MDKFPKPGRDRSTASGLLAVGLAVLVVGSLAGHAVGSPGRIHVTTPPAGAFDAEKDNVTLDVDCDESVVRVTAPAAFEYTLRVSNVVVTPQSTEAFTATTTESGNATVSLTEDGPVYAFVSSEVGLVASAFENCTLSTDSQTPTETTRAPGSGVASAEIDCNASEVRIAAPSEFAYTLRVSNIVATPQSTEVFTTALTASGNATVPLGNAGAVAVFVSNETGTVANAFDNCEFGDDS